MIRRMFLLSALAFAAVAQTAQATPISGTENLASSTVTISGTSYTFNYPATGPGNGNKAIVVGSSGDLSIYTLGQVYGFNGPLDISSVAGFKLTEMVGGVTTVFTATSAISITPGPQGNFDLLGTLTMTGKDATPAQLDIALATAGSPAKTSATFSLSTLAVPEPSTIGLMGLGMVGLVAGLRRKRTA